MSPDFTVPCQIQIRSARTRDLNPLAKLISLVSHEESLGVEAGLTNNTVTSEILAKVLLCPESRLLVALDGSSTVGMGCLAYSSIEPPGFSVGMCIRSDYRGKGLGTLLLKTLLESCPQTGNCKIFLSVLEDNQRAIRLYEKFGFSSVKTKKTALIKNGRILSEIIMEKNI